ncbi:MAG: SMP-30/gluconolactonase/LRE family protein [Myxococcales bacterium]|nr:SMP-30/gluconolactonase/LRE family protein [Myxococcales bacterium]
MKKHRLIGVASALSLAIGVGACVDGSNVPENQAPNDSLPTTGPTKVELVVAGGTQFIRPGDAVASPDGTEFVFTAFALSADDDGNSAPALFRVPSSVKSEATPIHVGAPLAAPMGLVMDCDGSRVFVADRSRSAEDDNGQETGAIYTISTSGGALTELPTSGIGIPSGLALNSDCSELYITGTTPDGEPALFTLSASGGSARVVVKGEPLGGITGVHVDKDNVAWVLDHTSGQGASSDGVLYAITRDGEITVAANNLYFGSPGGVSLASGGETAVIPGATLRGGAALLTINTKTGEVKSLETPEILDPAGVRTAKNAGVFVVVDAQGDAIFRAE